MMQSAVSANGKSDKEKMPMEKKISCCGTVCSDCEYYPADCQGCREVKRQDVLAGIHRRKLL